MLILGIDTSGRDGSVALLSAERDEARALEVVALAGGQYSELLVPTIAGLLARHGAAKDALGLIGVASGPGSFTGLRIAVATVKGLAEAFGTPVVAVSALEAVVLAAGANGTVLAALDAQRSEVFLGEYEVEAGDARTVRESVAKIGDFAGLVAQRVFTPDEGLAAKLRDAGVDAELIARPAADAFGRIAYAKFVAGAREDVAALDANYVRRSDAEIFVLPKLGSVAREQ